MNNKYFPRDFSLGRFIEVYISKTFEKLSKPISLESFDMEIRKKVSNEVNISEEIILALHHPFHWTFFCEDDCPFAYTSPKEKNSPIIVEPKKNYVIQTKEFYKKMIMDKYKDYLTARINNIEHFLPSKINKLGMKENF